MELSIIKSLLDKEFYDEYRGAKCPTKLFTKEVGKIKSVVDDAMTKYGRDLTIDEVEGLFFTHDPTLTTSQKHAYKGLFEKLRREEKIGHDVAQDILASLFRQYLGEQIANLGFDYVNGNQSSLEPLRKMLDNYRDDFVPDINVE
jgi:hypothetical protein